LGDRRANWVPCGYIARSKSGGNAVIMISTPGGEKAYYVADLNEVLDALTGRASYARILRRKG
jgi:hypothetical protein